jgi:hypothetical protein
MLMMSSGSVTWLEGLMLIYNAFCERNARLEHEGGCIMSFSEFVNLWTTYLNNDGEIKRRVSNDKTIRDDLTERNFAGTPSGHYEHARALEKKHDRVWPRSMGLLHYPHGGKSMLDGKDLIELSVPSQFTYTISLKDGMFRIRNGKGDHPCLSAEMPLSVLKELLLTRHRVVYALADPRNKITCTSQIPHGDWITIFEILVTGQEVVDMDPKMCEIVESL